MSTTDLEALAGRVAASARVLAITEGGVRADALRAAARQIRASSEAILAANAADLQAAHALSETARDRLRLDERRIEAMAQGVCDVADLPDPLGNVASGGIRPNGLAVTRVHVPLGVVGVIYENRPNVTSDAAALCVRSGNAAFLRGSSSSLRSNQAIVACLRAGLAEVGLPVDGVALLEDVSHERAIEFMQLREVIDVLIPRGGPSLIASMREHATVPYVLDGDGNCHVYVDRAADLDMAESIIINAKTQRPGVCNAMESLVLDRPVAAKMLSRLAVSMPEVRLLGDVEACVLSDSIETASEEDFGTEFLDLIATVAIVDGVDDSGHTEAIITNDVSTAERFLARVDAAAVVLNASTRFVDGAELGLGAEVGISTQKLHARGPMGLEALTSIRWVIRGEGQTRT